jgi:hypothetical protein
MTLDPERALTGAIFAHLCTDPAITAVLGEPPRVYDAPPLDPVFPYVTLGRSQARLWGGVDGEGTEHVLTLTVASRFIGMEEVRQIGGLVRAVLDDTPLTLTDHRLVSLRVTYTDVFRATNWRTIFAALRLRAVTEPLI